MSPTTPILVAPNDQLNKAHHRSRDLKSDEPKLFAQIRLVRAATFRSHSQRSPTRSTVELTSTPVQASSPDQGRGDRFGIGDQLGKLATQRARPPVAHPQENDNRAAPVSTAPISTKRTKTLRSHVV